MSALFVGHRPRSVMAVCQLCCLLAETLLLSCLTHHVLTYTMIIFRKAFSPSRLS